MFFLGKSGVIGAVLGLGATAASALGIREFLLRNTTVGAQVWSDGKDTFLAVERRSGLEPIDVLAVRYAANEALILLAIFVPAFLLFSWLAKKLV